MAAATSSNFGQSRPDKYGDVKMSVGRVPVDPRTAGTFQVNKVVRATPFDPYARLASTQSNVRIKIDGIQKAGEQKKILNTRMGQVFVRQLQEAKNEAERKVFLMGLTTRYEKISSDAERLKATPFPIHNKKQILSRYDSFSFLNRADVVSDTDLDSAHDNLPQLEADIASAITELTALEKKEEQRKRQLEMSALIAINNFENNKRLEAASLLQNNATLSEKDATEALVAEIDALGIALLSGDVTQSQITEFNQKLLELDTQIVTLKRLIEEGSVEKITTARQAEQLIALFEQKKSAAEGLLLNPVNAAEKLTTRALIVGTELISDDLKRSNDITRDEVNAFIAKIVELEGKITKLQQSVDAENSRQESMFSWHAEWPKEIKYVDAKKPNQNRPVTQGERGGWKKDGQLLKDQAIWGRLNAQAVRVFKRYNDLIDKALGSGKDGEVKDLVAIKEAVINALYADNTADATIALTRLEKQIEARKDEVENLVETKELAVKFEGVIKTLERLTSISPLEKDLLEAKKEELKGLKLELDKEETKKDSAKTKELLRIFRAILSELTSAVEEKDKEAKKEAAERLAEFKQLSRALESLKTKINHSLPSEISNEDKEELEKKILDIEREAKGFSESETKKEAERSREILTLFKTSLDKLTETVQKKINSVKKTVERKNSETEDFNKAVDFFEELQFVINDLENVSSDEQRSFARLVNELEEIKKSRSQEKDKGQLDQKSLLFRTLLGELASFVIKKLGNEDSIRRTITQLKEKLANATSQSLKDDILAKIKLHEKTLEKIQALKESKDSTAPRKKVLRAITNGATVFLREKDPLTGKPRKVDVSDWRESQSEHATTSVIEKTTRRSKAEGELRAIHVAMWEKDKDRYKSLYAGRTWTTSDRDHLTEKIVSEILAKQVASVDNELEGQEEEIAEYDRLLQNKKSGTITLDEKARMDTLERDFPLIKERKSLIERPYEEQIKMMREQRDRQGELMDQRQIYSPKDDRAMDLYPVYGVTGEEFRKKGLFSIFRKNSEAQQKYQIAKHAADQESASSKRGSIPGFTKTAINPTPLAGRMPDPITERDLVAEGGEGLAAVAYKQPKIKIGSEESMPNVAGMVRSVAKEDLSYQRNRDAVMIKPETGKILEEERATLTQEEQERRMTRVNGILSTLTKHAKSWRTWALIGTIAMGLGAPIIAFAGTENTTLEQTLSWKDLLGSMSEREQATLGNFINDLT